MKRTSEVVKSLSFCIEPLEDRMLLAVVLPGSDDSQSGQAGHVIYANDFDHNPVGVYSVDTLEADWNEPTFDNGVAQGRASVVSGSAAFSGNSLRVDYPEGGVGPSDGTGGGVQWKLNLGESYEQLHLSYRIRFGEDFDFVRGGKLPGLIGGAGNTGGNIPDGTDGWSARMMWRTDGSVGSTTARDQANVVQYVYHPDQPGGHAEDFPYDDGPGGAWSVFDSDRWYQVEHRLVMNTPGQRDGIMQAWIDGEQVLDVNDMRYRDVPELAIDQMYFSTFFGGSSSNWAPSKNESVYFDDFVVTVPDTGPTLSVDDAAVVENSAGGDPSQAEFTVRLSDVSDVPVQVSYTTVDVTALSGQDYQSANGLLTFNPGELEKTVSVSIVPDEIHEPSETFALQLSSPVGASLLDARGQGVIADDDAPPPAADTFQFEVIKSWRTGFIADVTIKNNETFTWEDWTVEFDLPHEIVDVYSAELSNQSGNRYTIVPTSYNQVVEPGGSVSFRFKGSKNTLAAPSEPTRITLNGQPVTNEMLAPEIVANPSDRSITEGSSTEFSVVVSGSGPIFYQWQRDGQDIASATSSSFSISAGTIADDQSRFRVVATNEYGTAVSQEALLAVTPGSVEVSVSDEQVVEGNGQIASGYLSTSGNQIVDAAGQPVRITGVNWFGMETDTFTPHGLWARNWKDMIAQIKDTGFNTIRLPISNELFDAGSTPNGIDFSLNPDLLGLSSIEFLDGIVDYAGQVGLRIILDHHRSNAGGGPNDSGLWYTDAYPESRLISDWEMLAGRYAGNATVIGADIHNEPHGPATWGSGDSETDWRLAAERIGNAILAVNPDWLIFVEGVQTYAGTSYWWGGNLDGADDHPVRLNVPGRLVYSPHDYPASVFNQSWFDSPEFPNNLPEIWDQQWGDLFRQGDAPILLGEFGGLLESASDQQWVDSLLAYLEGDFDNDGTNDLPLGQLGMSFTWWSWNPNSGDTGGILDDDWQTVNQSKLGKLQPHLVELPEATNSTSRSIEFKVRLSAPAGSAVSVSYTTVDGSATSGLDYIATSGTLVFAVGETEKTVSVGIISDTADESDETFFLQLNTANGATIADGEGQALIIDDDLAPVNPEISISDVTVLEGDSTAAPSVAEFVVSLSEVSNLPITIDYATSSGTAVSGQDYTDKSGSITFAPGEFEKIISVELIPDEIEETDETFFLQLSNSVSATIVDAEGRAIIRNDDASSPQTGSVEWEIAKTWSTGYKGYITITNTSNLAWTDWTLGFDLPDNITSIWGATIVEQQNGNYTIRPDSWNSQLEPGESIRIGFKASTGSPSQPVNVVLRETIDE